MRSRQNQQNRAQKLQAWIEQRSIPWDVESLRRSLLNWYAMAGRPLPWRSPPDQPDAAPPDVYRVWVSEIMRQQTQVKTVIPYFERWMVQFPSLLHLSNASQQEVLKAWQGLGYYARARNLHRAAQIVVTQYSGQFPQDFDAVLALPGIGQSTAGGILSSAFNLPYPILDGNVKRVLARLTALPVPPAQALKLLWECSGELLDQQQPQNFNQALMDLGATVCLPKTPLCPNCPWQMGCQAYNASMQFELPMREDSSPLPHKIIGVAVIWNDRGDILIDKRKESGLLGGLWEFPGGKVEPNESIEACIAREIQEELGIEIAVDDHLITVEHAYTHFRVTLVVHHCRYLKGEPQPLECDEIRWVSLADLDQFPFPKANVQIIEALRQSDSPFQRPFKS